MASSEANLDNHNVLDQVFPPECRATLPSIIPQPTIVTHLAQLVTTTTLNCSKYSDYVYFIPTSRPQNGWIWVYNYDIQHLRVVKKMEKHKSNEFAKSVSLYISTMIIINNVLSHNSQLSCKYDGEIPTTIHMVTHIATHGIGQDGSKIIKSKVKTKTELNFSGV